MSKKRSRDDDAAATTPAKKPAEEGPLKHRGLAQLKAARDALAAEAAAKEAAAKAEALAKGKPAPRPAVKPAPSPVAKKATPEVWRPDLDKELFAVAMSGVRPLESKDKPARVEKKAPGAPGGSSRDPGAKLRRAQAEGAQPVPTRWREDGGVEGARRDRSFALEALGRFAVPQDDLDLHGLDPAEARTRVEEFVRTRRARGLRIVRVVHGVGRHSPDGASLLRDAAVKALSESPGCRDVDAFQTAEPAHGGPGALLVALRAT